MIFTGRVTHLFATAFQFWGESVSYTVSGGSPQTITAVVKQSRETLENTAATSKLSQALIVKKVDVASPAYRDKVSIAGKQWTVEKVAVAADADFWELEIRKDEKLVY